MLRQTLAMRICNTSGKNIRLQLSWFIAVLSLLLAGAFYRSEARRLEFVSSLRVRLPSPLSALPMVIGDWEGQDVAIPELVQKVAANDDFVCRLYANRLTGQWAQIYVGFFGKPRTMTGHKPNVCYVSAGWVWDGSEQNQIRCHDGGVVPCMIHHFHRPDFSGRELVVLNFYVINGQISCDEDAFSGISWRTPNVAGNRARYVAQVQISSILEAFALTAGGDLATTLLDFFPNTKY